MLKLIRPAIVMIMLMTGLTGLVYPFAVMGVTQAMFPSQANGSLIERDGRIVGSKLIGQNFTSARYFQGRPSATTGADPADASKIVPAPYNAANSMGSNAGPTAKTLIERVKNAAAEYRQANNDGSNAIPADAVTTSGSGLDPHISPENAEAQIPRVAEARGLPAERVRQLVADATQDRTLGFLGEPRVNVLLLNISLDREQSGAQPGTIAVR
jgi:K+-transporting ATPase ATPase C chain